MDLFEAIEKRRTIRNFKKAATEEQLKKILLAGTKAPSGGNSEPWEFVVAEDQKLIDQIAEQKYQMNRKMAPKPGEGQDKVDERALAQKNSFKNCSVVAMCVQKGQGATGWLCVENISLAAVGLGLGCGIMGFGGDPAQEVKKILGIPENLELVCILKIGEPGESPSSPQKRPAYSWIHKNKY
jgi:nitroreductase